ncbi:methyltransferase domain-containing protein [Microbispora triticiradicis]|uniref:methyltransferase domain-containing protein n=1 Tax=Microbispora triticiradicis TaxID=2200763 RepID=UPI001AD77FD1|nr:methyltransferase domain-containing protein [Microbispora triticiradicis]
MYDREWDLLPEVFAPIYSPSTQIAMGFLGLVEDPGVPRWGSLLEMGSGTGLISVSAALAGCAHVVALDINPEAARNTAMNATRHGVADRVDARCSDLFASLGEGERFDLVFWSSNYVLAPPGFEYANMHDRAYVDAGYQAHRRFLQEVPNWLTPDGVALIHFSTRGDLVALLRGAGDGDRSLRLLADRTVREGELDIEHMLLEVTVSARRRDLAFAGSSDTAHA